jgi:hypothetical protein
MSHRLQVTNVDEIAGWLRIELVGPGEGGSFNDLHINNTILAALIQADIPVLSFGAEGGRLQDIFLQLTEEAIR